MTNSLSNSLRDVEDAVTAMRSLHQMLVNRFVALHGQEACESLIQQSGRLREEIIQEIGLRSRSLGSHETSSSLPVEYDPDDVEEVEVVDAVTGLSTGNRRAKLFAPPLAAELMRRVALTRANHKSSGVSCVICQEDIFYGQLLCQMPICGHEFCKACGMEWLEICGSCPTCRRVIVAADFAAAPPGVVEEEPSTSSGACSAAALASSDLSNTAAIHGERGVPAAAGAPSAAFRPDSSAPPRRPSTADDGNRRRSGAAVTTPSSLLSLRYNQPAVVVVGVTPTQTSSFALAAGSASGGSGTPSSPPQSSAASPPRPSSSSVATLRQRILAAQGLSGNKQQDDLVGDRVDRGSDSCTPIRQGTIGTPYAVFRIPSRLVGHPDGGRPLVTSAAKSAVPSGGDASLTLCRSSTVEGVAPASSSALRFEDEHERIDASSQAIAAAAPQRKPALVRPSSAPSTGPGIRSALDPPHPTTVRFGGTTLRRALELAPSAQRCLSTSASAPPRDTPFAAAGPAPHGNASTAGGGTAGNPSSRKWSPPEQDGLSNTVRPAASTHRLLGTMRVQQRRPMSAAAGAPPATVAGHPWHSQRRQMPASQHSAALYHGLPRGTATAATHPNAVPGCAPSPLFVGGLSIAPSVRSR